MQLHHFFIYTFALLPFLNACSEKKKGKAVNANFSMANSTAAALASDCYDLGGGFIPEACWTPSSFGIKMLSVYVSPDEDGGARSAPAGLIWLNKACSVMSSNSEVDGKEYSYQYAGDDCTDESAEGFFELARSTEEVNQDLNSQDFQILPGTYKTVHIGICVGGPKTKNVRFKDDEMADYFEAQNGACGFSSVVADPPLVVSEGQAITVKLSYDLTNILYKNGSASDHDPDSCYISDDESVIRCPNFPRNLKPSMELR
jgi:hypothetical protein